MASTTFVDNSLPAVNATWLNDVNDYVYGDITQKSIFVTDPAYGAVGDGITNDTGAIDTASALSISQGRPLVFPLGDYLYSGTVYAVDGVGMVINRGFTSSVAETTLASNNVLSILFATPNTSPGVTADTRQGIVVQGQGRGGQNATCIKAILQNYSTDTGGSAFYSKAISDTTATFSFGYHSETRHGGGTTTALNIEVATYSSSGSPYGIVLLNSTNGAEATNPITGLGKASNPNVTAIYIHGTNSTNAQGGWAGGIEFSSDSMRAASNCILFSATAAVESFIKTGTGTAAATADILLQGDSAYGLILNGAYTNAALRIADNNYIGLRSNNAIKMRYVTATNFFEITNTGTERFAVYLGGTPTVELNDTQILTTRQTGWAAATNTKARTTFDTTSVTLPNLAARVGALIDDLIAHGLIGA